MTWQFYISRYGPIMILKFFVFLNLLAMTPTIDFLQDCQLRLKKYSKELFINDVMHRGGEGGLQKKWFSMIRGRGGVRQKVLFHDAVEGLILLLIL